MNKKQSRDILFLKLLSKHSVEVTNNEVEYYRQYPEQIDEVTAAVNIHLVFLWLGASLGILFVGISKIIKYSDMVIVLSEPVREFTVDIVFEVGVALIGAAVTAYILGVVLNVQQDNAVKWRAEIRRQIKDREVGMNSKP